MNTYLKHLNTFRDTYDIARDYPFPWARLYVPDGCDISPYLHENFHILCDKHQANCYLHLENHEYFGTLEDLEIILMAWVYAQDICDTPSKPTLKEELPCTA